MISFLPTPDGGFLPARPRTASGIFGMGPDAGKEQLPDLREP
jgi:hypothetical protein